MIAKVLSAAVIGIDAYVVDVEVDISQGLPNFATVGLPEGAVRESKERVKAAIKNSGYHFPADRITVNLAPADIKKEGTAFFSLRETLRRRQNVRMLSHISLEGLTGNATVTGIFGKAQGEPFSLPIDGLWQRSIFTDRFR